MPVYSEPSRHRRRYTSQQEREGRRDIGWRWVCGADHRYRCCPPNRALRAARASGRRGSRRRAAGSQDVSATRCLRSCNGSRPSCPLRLSRDGASIQTRMHGRNSPLAGTRVTAVVAQLRRIRLLTGAGRVDSPSGDQRGSPPYRVMAAVVLQPHVKTRVDK